MLDLTSSSLPVTNLATPPYALSQQPVKVSHHYNVVASLVDYVLVPPEETIAWISSQTTKKNLLLWQN